MMKKLFNDDGHISENGFLALIEESELPMLPRLELSEHLDFCDICVDRYTGYLMPETLMDPLEETAPVVLKGLKKRFMNILLNRTCRVATAAGLTLVIWMGVIYGGDIGVTSRSFSENAWQSGESFQQMAGDWSKGIADFIGGFSIRSFVSIEQDKGKLK